MPATVANGETSFCIPVTVSRPWIALRPSTGWRPQSPFAFGRGEIRTWITTGPCGVNCTWRE